MFNMHLKIRAKRKTNNKNGIEYKLPHNSFLMLRIILFRFGIQNLGSYNIYIFI